MIDHETEFRCPRCHLEVREDFYGPCAACRTVLRDAQHGEAREVEVARFEPVVHVTPNAVALKDD